MTLSPMSLLTLSSSRSALDLVFFGLSLIDLKLRPS
jgi:hypothetical protein